MKSRDVKVIRQPYIRIDLDPGIIESIYTDIVDDVEEALKSVYEKYQCERSYRLRDKDGKESMKAVKCSILDSPILKEEVTHWRRLARRD